jgi:hypothetical protein
MTKQETCKCEHRSIEIPELKHREERVKETKQDRTEF